MIKQFNKYTEWIRKKKSSEKKKLPPKERNLSPTAAAPPPRPRYLEGELEVLAAPDVEAGVVGAEALEEGLVDGEEAARHGGRLHGLGGVLVAGALPLRDGVPVELCKGRRGLVSLLYQIGTEKIPGEIIWRWATLKSLDATFLYLHLKSPWTFLSFTLNSFNYHGYGRTMQYILQFTTYCIYKHT